MFEIQNYSSFIMAIIVFQLIPGAGTITILNATARGGIGSGMKAVFGTLSGDFSYMLAAVLGLAAILGAYPGVLATAQWIGVAYLCWMGLKLLITSNKDQPEYTAPEKKQWTWFRQALAVSLTNPQKHRHHDPQGRVRPRRRFLVSLRHLDGSLFSRTQH